MYGGTFICDKCGYGMAHYGSEETSRIACIRCDGWMHLKENFNKQKRTRAMPTTIFYIALVVLTSASFNFFWLIIAVIVDLAISARRNDDDSEW